MKHLNLKRYSSVLRDKVFNISTDVENFHNVIPEYFKSLSVIEKSKTGIVLVEKIKFLGISLKVKTKHVIKFPDVHMIYILSGPIKGTTFVEYYQNYDNGTEILIDIQLRFNGVFKLFRFLEGYVATRMGVVMD